MTMTATERVTRPVQADSTRNNARAAGIFYLLTFASSIPALLLIDPVLHNADYIVSSGHDTRVLWGCFLDLVNALTAVGSAVAVYPIVKRRNESLALGFVTSRMFEAAVIVIGVISLLTVVLLRQDFAGTAGGGPDSLPLIGQTLVHVRDWTFLLGPGFMAAINAVLFGTLMYKSGLVPRVIPMMGLIGAPILISANLLTFFGHNTQTSSWSMLATLPVAAWEFSVGSYMAFKGFKRTAITPDATA